MRKRAALSTVLPLAGILLFGYSAHGDPAPSAASLPDFAFPRPTMMLRGEAIALGDALGDEESQHLAINLTVQNQASLDQLLADLQNPASPHYHDWLTPAEFGARFGLPQATYDRIASWLESEGFQVTRYPNRLFVEAHGTVGAARRLLKVQARTATAGARTFRSYGEQMTVPGDIAPFIAKIGGLDTRPRLRHPKKVSGRTDVTIQGKTYQVLGAKDIRLQYDFPASGTGASGLTTVVLATQEGTVASTGGKKGGGGNPTAPAVPPSVDAINAYFTTLSDATATYNPISLPNTDNDFDTPGANGEYQLDVEMQSVGAAAATNIDLVMSPSSLVFQTGAQYIVNSLPTAVAVSSSLGDCEADEISGNMGATTPGSDSYIMRQAVQQGVAEGQTWFAAAGDEGADDCESNSGATTNGFNGGTATVDFPCSMPEIVCMGGTEFQNASGSWDSSGNLTAAQAEVVWSEGTQGGAGGGGQSLMYTKPTWQTGIGPEASDGARDVPDISLTASPDIPGVAVYDCGSGQQTSDCPNNNTGTGTLDAIGGTSVASPLGAGFFAYLAGTLGCRLGDIHATLYALGAAQQNGGAKPFNDITSGSNTIPDAKGATVTGFTAAAGYDLASGWGTVDMAKLIEAWPGCVGADGGVITPPPPAGDGGSSEGSSSGGSPQGGSSGGIASNGDGGGLSNPGEGDGGTASSSSGGGNGFGSGSGSGSSGGCGCTTAGAKAPNGAFAIFAALGVLALRRRKPRED
jgi:MYXO-CTERM domain-containing protein